MPRSKRDPLPKRFRTLEEAGEFWDTHDLGDYWDQTEPVEMSFHLKRQQHLLAVEPELARALQEAASIRGVSTETIANLWLRERLADERSPRRRKPTVRKAA